MNWYFLRRGDIAAILLVITLLGAMFIVHVVFPNLGSPYSNQGFGPGWECTNPGMGNSVCIKNPQAK
jgi:hypothetical protein